MIELNLSSKSPNEPQLVLQLTPTPWENQQKSTNTANCSMDELDFRLQELALAAKQSPAKSKARRRALTMLVNEVQNSNKIFCKGRFGFPREVYNEALQETWLYICQNIEKCDPNRGRVMTWVNFILEKRFINVINRRVRQGKQQSLDEPIWQNSGERDFQVTLLNRVEETNSYPGYLEWDNLRSFLEEDPDEIFKSRYIENNPEANFQVIALRRLNEESWKDISQYFQIPVPTLSTFYQRCVKHFTPTFKEYFQD